METEIIRFKPKSKETELDGDIVYIPKQDEFYMVYQNSEGLEKFIKDNTILVIKDSKSNETLISFETLSQIMPDVKDDLDSIMKKFESTIKNIKKDRKIQ